MTRAIVVPAGGRFLGVRFRPGRAPIALPAREATDARLELAAATRLDRALPERLASLPEAARIRALEEHLLAMIARPTPASGERAIHLLARTPGLRIEEVARASGLSARQLERAFLERVGVSPKVFARIARFRRAVALAGTRPWAALALDAGYYDQAHLVREFRALAGVTPTELARERGASDPSKTGGDGAAILRDRRTP